MENLNRLSYLWISNWLSKWFLNTGDTELVSASQYTYFLKLILDYFNRFSIWSNFTTRWSVKPTWMVQAEFTGDILLRQSRTRQRLTSFESMTYAGDDHYSKDLWSQATMAYFIEPYLISMFRKTAIAEFFWLILKPRISELPNLLPMIEFPIYKDISYSLGSIKKSSLRWHRLFHQTTLTYEIGYHSHCVNIFKAKTCFYFQ